MTSIQEVYPHIFIHNKWVKLLKNPKIAYDKCVEYIDTTFRPSFFEAAAGTKKPIVIPTQFITVTDVPNDETPDQVLEYMFYIDDKGTDYYGTDYYIEINGLYYKIEKFKPLPSANLPSNIKSLKKVTADNKITISFSAPFSGGRKYNYKTKNRKLKLYNNKSIKSIKSRKSRK